ncbi:MAG: ABC transporter substrate binding protein, partial [Bacteroidota bacterium]
MLKPILLFFLCASAVTLFGQVKIGIITDLKENAQSKFIIDELIKEINKTTGVNLKVQSSKDVQIFDISSESAAQNAYQKMNANLIISIGGLSTKVLAKLSELPKPVIGLGVIDPSLQQIPYNLGKSGKSNFTYLLTSRDIVKEIESFQKLAGFERLTLLIDPALDKTLTGPTREVLTDSIQNELNITVDIAVAGTIEETKASLANSEAVYLSAMISRNPAEIVEIADYLIEQKIPSFSTSKQHVEAGVLGSSSGDNGPEQIIRRVGIMVDDILSGRKAADIPVEFAISENFYLNIETARKMDFPVPFDVLLTASLIGERNAEGDSYSFSEIANQALEQNLNLKISYKDIDDASLDIRASKANILPSLSSGLTASQINEERANAAVNSPEKALNLDLTLTQVIYSEEALAAIKISRYLKNAQEYQTEVEVLNVLLDTYNAYLDVLSAKTNLRIQRENLDNTRTNLELAKLRVDIGSSTNSDLYRWESELANATQA